MNQSIPNLALTETKEENHPQSKRSQALPRTVSRANNRHTLLDGEWRFAHDPNDEGLRNGWHLQYNFQHTAQWPGSVEVIPQHGTTTL
jgi:hypothetical protein